MGRSSKFLILLLILALGFSSLIGCSSTKSHRDEISSDSFKNHSTGFGDRGPEPSDGTGDDFEDSDYQSEEDLEGDIKIITTMDLFLETTEFDKTLSKLNSSLKTHKGYMESSNISYDGYYDGRNYKYGNFSLRIPKKSLEKFKSELYGIGNLLSENTYKEDVTKSYRDTESRLKVITTKEERILALLEKANKIEDIIALEDQLSNIIYEKEELQASLLNLDDKIDYSTIHVEIREVAKLSDQENIETSFSTRIKNAFKNSLYGFNTGIQNFIIWLIYSLPFLILMAIFAYLAYRLLKKISNRNKL